MNPIHYFAHKNGTHFAAVAPGQYVETILFWEVSACTSARIEFNQTLLANADSYAQPERSYSPCSRETYLAARCKAQAATAEFFGEYPQFQTPAPQPNVSLMQGFMAQVRKPGPLVMLATGRRIGNDLPF